MILPAGPVYWRAPELTIWVHMRRFSHLTTAFSKKIENHAHSVARHMMYYNFGLIHMTLRVMPFDACWRCRSMLGD